MYTINTIKSEIEKRINAESTKEIDFGSANMEQKISVLKSLGGKIDDEKEYSVKRSFEIAENETAEKFAERVKSFASVNDIIGIMTNNVKSISVTAKVKGKNLSQKQTISVLSEQVKTDGQKVTIDICGGSNFVELLKYVRGLSDDEFTALIATK